MYSQSHHFHFVRSFTSFDIVLGSFFISCIYNMYALSFHSFILLNYSTSHKRNRITNENENVTIGMMNNKKKNCFFSFFLFYWMAEANETQVNYRTNKTKMQTNHGFIANGKMLIIQRQRMRLLQEQIKQKKNTDTF